MEPRSYSAVPLGTNFVVAGYARSTGDVSLDPSLPITDLQARINTYSLGYSHSFGVAGHLASIAALLPYANANLTGNVAGVPGQAWRSGLGDVRFRIAVNLLGGPALTPQEFSQRVPSTILGASLSVGRRPANISTPESSMWARTDGRSNLSSDCHSQSATGL
jgi:hypothetical protein